MERQDSIIENSKSINDFVIRANALIDSYKEANKSKFDIINEISLLYDEHNKILKSFITCEPRKFIAEDINEYIEALMAVLKVKRNKLYHKTLAL